MTSKLSMHKRLDPNEIVLLPTHAELVLYHKDQSERCRAIIDLDDVPSTLPYRWWLTENGYVRAIVDGRYTFLHVHLTGRRGTDHRDLNRLNNCRSNLRPCTKSQNGMNRLPPRNNSTGHTGVSFDKRRCKYRAYIKLNGKQLWIGYFTSMKSAAAHRRAAENLHFGEYQCLFLGEPSKEPIT